MTPVLFVSHGAPTTALETEGPFAAALRAFAERVRPKAVVIVSAHWQTRAPAVRATGGARPEIIYDFGGFPDVMYTLKYPAPGAPALAREIVDALAESHVDGAPKWQAAVDDARGWDHGAWVPLKLALPEANVPVVQLSLPTALAERRYGFVTRSRTDLTQVVATHCRASAVSHTAAPSTTALTDNGPSNSGTK